MSAQNFDVSQINTGDARKVAWEKEIDLVAPGNSDWLLVPDEVQGLTVTLSFTGGGSGKVQSTTDKVDTVKTGSPVAVDWPLGEVSSSTQDFCLPVTAIRAVQINAGTLKMTARAQ
jgi:hypothetical protein